MPVFSDLSETQSLEQTRHCSSVARCANVWDDSRKCEFLARRRQRVVEAFEIRQKDDTELQSALRRQRQVSCHFLPGLEASLCQSSRVVRRLLLFGFY